MLRLAGADAVHAPFPLLVNILKDLPRLSIETNIYAIHLRVEFSLYAYPSIDAKKIADIWSKVNGN